MSWSERRAKSGRSKEKARYGLSIVRTLAYPQSDVTELVDSIHDALGPAFEPEKEIRGVSLLESRAVLSAIKDRRGSIDKKLLAEAEQRLVSDVQGLYDMQEVIRVEVNPDEPLRTFGRHGDVMALNLVKSFELGCDRTALEICVNQNYPTETDISRRAMQFEPHITLGKIKPQLLPHGHMEEFQIDPLGYIDSPPPSASRMDILIHKSMPGIPIPEEVALNGLRIKVESSRLV